MKAASKGWNRARVRDREAQDRRVGVNRFREGARASTRRPRSCSSTLVGERTRMALAQEIDKVDHVGGSDPGADVGEREMLDLVAPWSETPPWEHHGRLGRSRSRRERCAPSSRSSIARAHRAAPGRGRPHDRRRSASISASCDGSGSPRRRVSVRATTRSGRSSTRSRREAVSGRSRGCRPSSSTTRPRRSHGLDFALKGGSRLSPDLELQRAVTAVSVDRARHATTGQRRRPAAISSR